MAIHRTLRTLTDVNEDKLKMALSALAIAEDYLSRVKDKAGRRHLNSALRYLHRSQITLCRTYSARVIITNKK